MQEQALCLAVKEFDKNRWDTISEHMLKHGCVAKWPKEQCQRKWLEMNPQLQEGYPSQYEVPFRHRGSEDWNLHQDMRSDCGANICHNFHEVDSAIQMADFTTLTMDEVRSRAASDASSQMLHTRHQRRQQHLMFDEQQRQTG